MNRALLPIACLTLTLVPGAAHAADRCSIASMPQAQLDAIGARYSQLKRTAGQAQADAFVRQQGLAYHRQLVAQGICPGSGEAEPAPVEEPEPAHDDPAEAPREGARTNCRLENRNVPNIGGSMGWALLQVCD